MSFFLLKAEKEHLVLRLSQYYVEHNTIKIVTYNIYLFYFYFDIALMTYVITFIFREAVQVANISWKSQWLSFVVLSTVSC